MQNAPAGWYPDPDARADAQPWHDPAEPPDRSWDGRAWTDQVRPHRPPPTSSPRRTKPRSAFYIGVSIILAPIVIAITYLRLAS